MAGFFGRGTSNNGNNSTVGSGGGGGWGSESAGGDQRGDFAQGQASGNQSGINQSSNTGIVGSGGGGGADYQGNFVTGGTAYGTETPGNQSNAPRGNTSMARSDSSGWSVGTGSQFGSINNEEMDKASISTFGNATSVASSDFNAGQGKSATRNQGSGGYGQDAGMRQQTNRSNLGGNEFRGLQQPAQSSGMSQQQDQSQGMRGGGGSAAYANEDNDRASMTDEPNIAVAGDFKSDTANIIFLSSESGQGANRQPITRFRIHEVNLNVHSAVLSEMVDDDDDDDGDDEVDNNGGTAAERTPVVLEEDAATLKLLFGLMYNRPSPPLSMSDWQVVLRMARAAQKYNCARAKEVAAAYFTEQEQLGALSPFMTYAFATQYKLDALEEAAAERSVRYDLHRLPELVFSMMGFSAYQKLSAFHSRRQSFYSDVLTSISIDPKELADQCYQTGGVCAVGPWNKIKQRLQWPRQAGRDGSKKPPEPSTVLRALVLEVSSLDCGSCSRALAESCLTVQTALTSLPGYREEDEASF